MGIPVAKDRPPRDFENVSGEMRGYRRSYTPDRDSAESESNEREAL